MILRRTEVREVNVDITVEITQERVDEINQSIERNVINKENYRPLTIEDVCIAYRGGEDPYLDEKLTFDGEHTWTVIDEIYDYFEDEFYCSPDTYEENDYDVEDSQTFLEE